MNFVAFVRLSPLQGWITWCLHDDISFLIGRSRRALEGKEEVAKSQNTSISLGSFCVIFREYCLFRI